MIFKKFEVHKLVQIPAPPVRGPRTELTRESFKIVPMFVWPCIRRLIRTCNTFNLTTKKLDKISALFHLLRWSRLSPPVVITVRPTAGGFTACTVTQHLTVTTVQQLRIGKNGSFPNKQRG